MDLLYIHHLSRRKRKLLRSQLREDLLQIPAFEDFDQNTQKKFLASAGTALATKMLLRLPEDSPSIQGAKEKILDKSKRGNPSDYFLLYPRPWSSPSPIREEFLLFCAAVKSGQERHFPRAKELLRQLTPLDPAPIFEIPPPLWEKFAWSKGGLLAIYDSTSELILMKADGDRGRAEHIALHEMIHSLQRHVYSKKDQAQKALLLEGVTEETTVFLDREYGFYKEERHRTLCALEKSSYFLEDFVFSSGGQIYNRLLEEIPAKKLSLILKAS